MLFGISLLAPGATESSLDLMSTTREISADLSQKRDSTAFISLNRRDPRTPCEVTADSSLS